MRTLQRLRIPTLLFVNKIDRARRAATSALLRAIAEKLTPAIVAMGSVDGLGHPRRALRAARRGRPRLRREARRGPRRPRRRAAGRLRRRRGGGRLRDLRRALAAQTRRALVHPVFFGSAITGAGVDALIGRHPRAAARRRGRRRRPAVGHRVQGRARAGRREDRLRADVLGHAAHARPAASRRRRRAAKVTAISVFDRGAAVAARVGRRGTDRQAAGLGERQHRRRDRRPPPRTTRPAPSRRRRSRPSSCPAARPTGARCTSRSPSSPSRTR